MANSKDDKVFDIANPGSASAHPNARPVIVPHRTLLRDPMMSGKKLTDVSVPKEQKEDEEKLENTVAKDVKPPDAEDKPSKLDAEEPKKEPTEEERPAEADDSIIESSQKDEAVDAEENKKTEDTAEKQQDEKYEKLVEDKTYFVPIGAVKRRRNIRAALIIMLVILVAGLVVANFLADAGIIHLPVQPFTDVIKNNQ